MLVFAHEQYLWLTLVILALGGVLIFSAAIRTRLPLRRFPVFATTLTSLPVFLLKSTAFLGAVVFAFFTALGPREQILTHEPIREGMTVVASADCSLSMLAPMGEKDRRTRISVVLESIHAVFQSLPHDRKGVSCFAENVLSSSTLTTDYVRVLGPQIDKITEYFIATAGAGTNFSAALDGCFRLFDSTDTRRKVCIILSDGEPQGDEKFLRRELQKKVRDIGALIRQHAMQVSFYIVGIGDPGRAYKIPRKDARGNFAGFVCCDEDGHIIETRPDPTYLEGIARTMDGTFIHINNASDLVSKVSDIIAAERKVIRYKPVTTWQDMSWPFSLALIFLLVVWFFLPKRISLLWKRGKTYSK